MNSRTTFATRIGTLVVALVIGIASIVSAKGQADRPRPYRYQGTYGTGMMGGGMMGGGMVGGAPWWGGNGLPGSSLRRTVDINKAETLVSEYLTRFGAENLKIEEIMEFENNLYALIVEADTGKGAFELLVDPFTGVIRPEYGPNVMWNTKYGMMGSWGGAAPTRLMAKSSTGTTPSISRIAVTPGVHYEFLPDGFAPNAP